MIYQLLLAISILGLTSSTVFLLLAIEGARRFRQNPTDRRDIDVSSLPPIAVLKPLHGLEPHLLRNLESFFVQDYPAFELIFGARSPDDEALKVVADLQKKYPQIKTKIVLSGKPIYPNAKVFTLEKMIRQCRESYFVITDSDVCVTPNCLREVITPLLDERNGVVTCLYTGLAAGGFWSQLEALGMSVEMPSGVLVANMLEGMRFALGPIMATRRDLLERIGGLAALAHYCADDYKLGNLAYESGQRVILSTYVGGHVAMNTSVRTSLAHQIRWMRSTRFSRSAGHVGTGLTFALPFGLIGLMAGGLGHNWKLGGVLFAWAFLNRVIQAIVIGWATIGDSQSLKLCWLYPFRDLMGFLVWCSSFMGDEILWRNERYRLVTDGKLIRL